MAKLIVGENDLKTLCPKLIEEWDYSKNEKLPEMFTTGTHAKAWWHCSICKQSWEATIASRVRGAGCPYCAGKRVLQGFNDLMTIRPDIAMEWHPAKNLDLKPTEVTSGSNNRVWWKCSRCGHEWQASVKTRNTGNTYYRYKAELRSQ